jgi:hypothetical protein
MVAKTRASAKKQPSSNTVSHKTDSENKQKTAYSELPNPLQKELVELLEKSGGIAGFVSSKNQGHRLHKLLSKQIQLTELLILI